MFNNSDHRWEHTHQRNTRSKPEEMTLVLNNNIAITTTTPSLTRPIPSPGPFSSMSGNQPRRCSEDRSIFTYSNAYPIPHCVHNSGKFGVQDKDFNSSECDVAILDDDALTSLILEMELEQLNALPELQVVNADLTDCTIRRWSGKQQASESYGHTEILAEKIAKRGN